MAEAHGQLTGRPAVCLGTRAVGGGQPRDRHPHGSPGLDPDVRRRSARSSGRCAAARRSRRSTRSRRSAAWPSGRPSRRRADDVAGDDDRGRSARPSAAGPDRSCCPSPRTCSTSRWPTDDADRDRHGRARHEPTDDEIRAVIELLASAQPPGHPGRCRRPPRADVDRADPVRRAPAGPGHRAPGVGPTSSRTTIRSTSGWPASGPRRSVRERLDAADALARPRLAA